MRTITYTVGVDKISPSTVQFGGFAGEHCATRLHFDFDSQVASKIQGCSGMVNIAIEVENSDGTYENYPVATNIDNMPEELEFDIPKRMSDCGGVANMQLTIVELAEDELTIQKYLLCKSIKLRFSPSVPGGVKGSMEYERYHTGVLSAMVRAEQAADKCKDIPEQLDKAKYYYEKSYEFASAAESAKSAAETAKSEAESAKSAAETAKSETEFAEAMARTYADSALENANNASGYVGDAWRHASDAQSSANSAWAAKDETQALATLAKRYAVGGTGTVEGEDLDNAKAYYLSTKGASEAIVRAKRDAEDAASRAESAMIAVAGEWTLYKEVVLENSVIELSEQVESLGDTKKGVRVKVVLSANTTLPNNRLTAYINLNNNRRIDVRGEGWTTSNTATVCYFDIRPYDDVWNAETVPYAKTISGITGDLTYAEGDYVRYIKLKTNETNPIPAGTKIEIWGLQ